MCDGGVSLRNLRWRCQMALVAQRGLYVLIFTARVGNVNLSQVITFAVTSHPIVVKGFEDRVLFSGLKKAEDENVARLGAGLCERHLDCGYRCTFPTSFRAEYSRVFLTPDFRALIQARWANVLEHIDIPTDFREDNDFFVRACFACRVRGAGWV